MAQYPDIDAGDQLSVEMLRAMITNYIIKPSTETRTSTTTVADDADLIVPLEANAITAVKFVLRMAGLAAADIKTQWSVPAGATGAKHVLGPSTVAADTNADNITVRMGAHGYTTPITYNGVRNSASATFLVIEEALITTTTAGNCTLQWAQGTSNATGSIIAAGSWVEYRRIG